MYLEGGGIWSVLLLSALNERISKIMYFTSTYKHSMHHSNLIQYLIETFY